MVKSFFSEGTFLPVSLVITLLTGLVWIITSVVRNDLKTDAIAVELAQDDEDDRERDRTNVLMLQQLGRIETRVDYIYDVVKTRKQK